MKTATQPVHSTNMHLTFRPLTEQDTEVMFTWRYETPYDIYNPTRDNLFWLLDPENRYHAIVAENSALLGFFCLGLEARVRGGDYDAEDALDVGFALRPDLVGRGLGAHIFEEILNVASRELSPLQFRVTVATFNQRAQRLFARLGFRPLRNFQGQGVWYKYTFVQMVRVNEAARRG